MSTGRAGGQEKVHSFHACADALVTVLGAIGDDHLSGPTPSGSWTVRDLLGHVDALSRGLTATARKLSPPSDTLQDSGSGPSPGPDWREDLPVQLREMARAWAEPTAWEGTTTAGTVELPADVAGMFALDELVVHGWELARATGQDYVPDPSAVRACLALMESAPRAPELFGPAVPIAQDAPAIDHLVALTGRDPRWKPPGPARARPGRWGTPA